MDCGIIGGPTNQAVKGVYLTYQMPFAETANGRVAGHCTNHVFIETYQCNAQPHTRSDRRRLSACVAAAYHDDVKIRRHTWRIAQVTGLVKKDCDIVSRETLFTDAEFAEYIIQQFFGMRTPCKRIESQSCKPQIFGNDKPIARIATRPKSRHCLREQRSLPEVYRKMIRRRKKRLRSPCDAREQSRYSGAGHGRDDNGGIGFPIVTFHVALRGDLNQLGVAWTCAFWAKP